ncbi:MAG: MTH938/NDUFAF3 family protein [Nitrospirota bacterium]
MKITHYSFGKIVIDNKTYTSDVIIYPDHVDPSWRRKEGHNLSIDDLIDAISSRPEILLIGKGFLGVMKVPEETVDYIRSQGIEVRVERTGKAAGTFNSLQDRRRIIAVFHLTC